MFILKYIQTTDIFFVALDYFKIKRESDVIKHKSAIGPNIGVIL